MFKEYALTSGNGRVDRYGFNLMEVIGYTRAGNQNAQTSVTIKHLGTWNINMNEDEFEEFKKLLKVCSKLRAAYE